MQKQTLLLVILCYTIPTLQQSLTFYYRLIIAEMKSLNILVGSIVRIFVTTINATIVQYTIMIYYGSYRGYLSGALYTNLHQILSIFYNIPRIPNLKLVKVFTKYLTTIF